MSGIKGVFKEGWHPKGKDGKKESWRGDFKGINQVAGWVGKGKDKDSEREEHVSKPLSSLKDPAAFGPPPKHVKYHGAAAVPNQTTPDRRGLGAPLSQEQIHPQDTLQQQEQAEAEAEPQKPAPPPLPFRANRTGVDPSTLPPPPVRRTGSPAYSAASGTKPSIPPRIPPRTNSTPQSPSPPPPAYSPHATAEQSSDGYLNQGAASRLAQAGVSVPSLGIGDRGDSPRSASPATGGSISQAPVSELQTRFSQMRTNSDSPSRPPPPPARGSLYGRESSTASASHAQNATDALKDFREKHDDKIQAGKQKISGLNEKYGISKRVNSLFDDRKGSTSSDQAPPPVPPHPNLSRSNSSVDPESISQKKAPPPPPPPKKSEMRSTPVNASSPTPPPVPLGTKPR
ncbi:hypothetical protein BDV26DRAFT_272780 [Aspergillus bertholletiae]|uniref:Altered inheritance of mitochondria protein 3 n=1 Tax=Aspergillus bertholletiae TaxID=1226010 RepID=A0A5N7ATB7_9EURO|nr:hypothetical protein BDV26DRAFT_272780 [Aspergillus bertholletiae]